MSAMVEIDAAELAELRADKLRLDYLQEDVEQDGPLLLHDENCFCHGFRGLGLGNTNRTLRQAIDDMRRHEHELDEPTVWPSRERSTPSREEDQRLDSPTHNLSNFLNRGGR